MRMPFAVGQTVADVPQIVSSSRSSWAFGLQTPVYSMSSSSASSKVRVRRTTETSGALYRSQRIFWYRPML